MDKLPPFFWLHIKKSAGQSTRKLLAPEYRQVDRSRKPKTFISADVSEYNDILNNFRIPLGDYQFRRAKFAKTFLFPEVWDEIPSFAFSRDPVRRCVSAFFNLTRDMERANRGRVLYAMSNLGRTQGRLHRKFDRFCEMIEAARASDSIYQPYGLSFSTHTATMFDDVTDDDGKILLRYIFRLEDLISGINQVFEEAGIDRKIMPLANRANSNAKTDAFQPTRAQIRCIESLYPKDFELHESGCHRI